MKSESGAYGWGLALRRGRTSSARGRDPNSTALGSPSDLSLSVRKRRGVQALDFDAAKRCHSANPPSSPSVSIRLRFRNASSSAGSSFRPLARLSATPLRLDTSKPRSWASAKKTSDSGGGFSIFLNARIAVLVRVPACAKVTGGSSTTAKSSASRAIICRTSAAIPFPEITPSGTTARQIPPGRRSVKYRSMNSNSESGALAYGPCDNSGSDSGAIRRNSSVENRAPNGGLVRIRSASPSYLDRGVPSSNEFPTKILSVSNPEKIRFARARRTIRSTLS